MINIYNIVEILSYYLQGTTFLSLQNIQQYNLGHVKFSISASSFCKISQYFFLVLIVYARRFKYFSYLVIHT